MISIDVVEELPTRISPGSLSEDDAVELAQSGRFDVTFPSRLTDGAFELRAKGWVGHFPLASGSIIRVQPKVPVANVLEMLDTVYGFKSFELLGSAIAVNDIQNVAGHLASVLAKRISARCAKGLYGAYVERDETLGYIRGRVNVASVFTALERGRVTVPCRYEEFTQDITDNCILLWTLHVLSRADLPSFARHSVRSAYRALRHTVSLVQTTREDLTDRTYTKLNSDYVVLHALCRFFLDNLSPGLRAGNQTAIPFSIYMPGLFESFASEWLQARLPPQLVIKPKLREKLPGDFSVVVIPDLLVCDRSTQKPLAVIDTKYKFSEKPLQSDIFQVVSYATHFSVETAFLLYPLVSAAQSNRIGKVSVRTLFFDLSADIKNCGNNCVDVLTRALAS